VCCLASLAACAAFAADVAPAAKLTSEQIVERNVAARGGLEAWRAVTSLTLSGKVEAGGTTDPELPFVMKMKRPHKSRMEIRFKDKTAIQVYDGTTGWKVRPFLNREEVEPYTPAEAKQAKAWEELDGPLMDYARKGTRVTLIGKEAVEGHDAYKLKLTMKDAQERNLWIDATTFLELKIDGEPRRVDGRMRKVAVFYRDFKKQNGLLVASVLETLVEGAKQIPHKMRIETVAFNEPMADDLFAKPQLAMAKAAGR
jgi:hypothetical protein